MPEISQISPPPKPLNKKTNTFKIVLYLVILAILLIALLYLLQQRKKSQSPTTTPPVSQKTTAPTYTTKVLSSEEIIKLLPANLPFEKDAQNLQSSQFTDKDGTEQITYQYITKKTLDENFNLYKTFLEKNKWKLLNTLDNQDLKSLSASKETEKKTISITISKNTITGQSIVDISLISLVDSSKNITKVQNLLLSKAKISFPEISQQEEITKSELPSLLQKFIIQDSKGVKIQRVDYSNQQKGFYIGYNIQDITMADLQYKLSEIARNSQLQPLANSRAEIFGFLEYEKESYQIRITYTKQDQNNIKVTLQVI